MSISDFHAIFSEVNPTCSYRCWITLVHPHGIYRTPHGSFWHSDQKLQAFSACRKYRNN